MAKPLYCHECGGLLEEDYDGSYWCSNCQTWTIIPYGQKKYYRDPDAYIYYASDDPNFENYCGISELLDYDENEVEEDED